METKTSVLGKVSSPKDDQTVEQKIEEILKKKYKDSEVGVEKRGSANSIYIQIRIGNNFYKISADLKVLPMTCGMYEIGNIVDAIWNSNIEFIGKNRFGRFLGKALLDCATSVTKQTGKFGLCCTIPFEKPEYEIFEIGLTRAGFKITGEFKNSNSGNNLRFYVLI